jgi:UDP-N-acetylglucosamine--N-acetylmuramyl-(pentapeptide) pyrophosphoryl-undecaprenol N-acetylglucosamine transferase
MRGTHPLARSTSSAAPLRVLFAGGGTGGHLFPALAIAGELKVLHPDAQVLFVGTQHKIEARVVPQHGFAFRTIWISGFHRSLRISNLLFPVKVMVAMMQAFSILRQFRPDVVVGTGGYVSGPMLFAAALRRVPTLIQEQNSFPGETTRFLAKRVSEVHITFEESRRHLPRRGKVILSGNPTRASLDHVDADEALRFFGFGGGRFGGTLLVFGGSLGAGTINRALEQHLDALIGAGLRIIWQTGASDAEAAAKYRLRYGSDRIWAGAFIDRMEYAYAASTLVLCRAGATTIAELTRLGKPAVLVPYPHAAADHQTANARALVEAGAAVMIEDRAIGAALAETVLALLSGGETLAAMSAKCLALGKPRAARVIAEHVAALAEGRS